MSLFAVFAGLVLRALGAAALYWRWLRVSRTAAFGGAVDRSTSASLP